MINAPSTVVDKLESGNFKYANLYKINLGDAYDTDSDLILYYTDYHHNLEFDGNVYTTDHNLVGSVGISRKASTGSDSVDLKFSVTSSTIIEAIKSERYINKPTSIDRVIVVDGVILENFKIPVRTAWGLSHSIDGDISDRTITLTIDSVLGDLDGDNGWYTITSSHEQRYTGDKIMKFGQTVMTEEQKKRYTTNFKGTINQDYKPPALPKIYGYKNVELIPIMMLKHRKSHTTYRHYFTTLIYAVNIGDCDYVDLKNLRKDGEAFEFTIVNSNSPNIGGWSCRLQTPAQANTSMLSKLTGDLAFWFEQMDLNERNRFISMYGKGLTLLFFKNRNRDDWLTTPPKLTVPVRGSRVFDPRTGLTVYSRNPALQYADYLRSTEYGAGKRNIPITDATISALANHFDSIPDSIGNPGINSIYIDVQINTGDPIVDNMNVWMEGTRLYTSDYYGEFLVRVETKSPVVWTFDEDDLIDYPSYDSGKFTDRFTQLTYSIKQLVPDTTEGAEPGALVEVDVEATFPAEGSTIYNNWLAEDGGIVNFESESLNYVTELEQAFYWTMVDARISRQPRELTLPVGPIGWLMEVGDVIEFNSEIMDQTDTLWRIDEITEDDENVELSLIAYSNDFYTPDPAVIPAPVAPAQPPTAQTVAPVTGLALTKINGEYYLNWDVLSTSNITWYSVEILDGETVLLADQKVTVPPFKLTGITVGSYTATVTPNTVTNEGVTSTLAFNLLTPVQPLVNVIPKTLEVQIIPYVTGFVINQTYELLFNTVDNQATATNYGTSGSFTITGLSALTPYYYWVRAVNPLGQSAWLSGSFTTLNDATAILDLIGEDVTGQILPDVIEAVEGELQTVVDGALVNYPTTSMVNGLIDDALETVGLQDNEDVRISIVEQINSIFDTNKRRSEIKTVNAALISETETRALQINTLQVKTDTNQASITSVNEALTNEVTTRASQYSLLSANDTAIISRIDSVESTADGNYIAISALEGTVNNPTTGLTASYNLAQTAESKADGNTSSITVLQNTVNNPTTGLSAAFTLAGQAKSTADGNTSSIGTLTTSVAGAQGTASSALTLASNLDNSLDAYRASAQLKVDALGNVSFIQLDATPTVSQVKFKADQIFFLNNSNVPVVYWNTSLNKYVFVGEIQATSGIFTGNISGATGSFSGTVSAANVVGDTAAAGSITIPSASLVEGSSPLIVVNVNINAQPYVRKVVFPAIWVSGYIGGEYTKATMTLHKNNATSYIASSQLAGVWKFSGPPVTATLNANESANFKLKIQPDTGYALNVDLQEHVLQIIRNGNQTTYYDKDGNPYV